MIKHKETIQGKFKDMIWVWYEGTASELLVLRQEALNQYGEDVRVGSAILNQLGTGSELCLLPFVFLYPKDAMMFKLSN